jgi:integrase
MLRDEIKNYEYTGPLSEIIREYIQQKRAAGRQYNAEAKYFSRFDKFTKANRCPANALPQDIVEKWVGKRPNEKLLTQLKRTNAVKRFAEYMREHGFDAYISPYSKNPSTDEYIPHIFSSEEMRTILVLADEYQATIGSPNLDKVVPLVFRILYGCGLRVSEVLSLKLNDVKIEEKCLFVRDSKFRKDRIVPMSQSLTEKCLEYMQSVHVFSNENNYFIQSPNKRRYHDQSPYHWFRTILRQAGISHGGKGKGPRLHDIRHTFAVHCIKKWALSGKNVNSLLPILSVYMGHCDLRGTQVYIRLTADLFEYITSTMEDAFYSVKGGGIS